MSQGSWGLARDHARMPEQSGIHSGKISDRPLCPACGDRMQLVRVVPRGSYIAEQAVFQCERCHVALTHRGERESN
jgi:hypothetical protein